MTIHRRRPCQHGLLSQNSAATEPGPRLPIWITMIAPALIAAKSMAIPMPELGQLQFPHRCYGRSGEPWDARVGRFEQKDPLMRYISGRSWEKHQGLAVETRQFSGGAP